MVDTTASRTTYTESTHTAPQGKIKQPAVRVNYNRQQTEITGKMSTVCHLLNNYQQMDWRTDGVWVSEVATPLLLGV